MTDAQSDPSQQKLHLALPMRLTEGILVQRTTVTGAPAIATNVPPLRHASQSGFDFGNDGPGASDLALACTHAILSRMDYVGPVQKLTDGNRVFQLAVTLHEPFRAAFIEPAAGDELRITWSHALGWMRRSVLKMLREQGVTQETLIAGLQRMQDDLPQPLPGNELDQAALNRQLRDAFTELAGDASMLSQFLGLIA